MNKHREIIIDEQFNVVEEINVGEQFIFKCQWCGERELKPGACQCKFVEKMS